MNRSARNSVGRASERADEDFAEVVLASLLPVLVEFTADWCPPCRQMKPVLSALGAEAEGRLKVVQLNVDTSPETALAYRVMSMPTFMLLRAGQPVKSMVGARTGRRLREELADVL